MEQTRVPGQLLGNELLPLHRSKSPQPPFNVIVKTIEFGSKGWASHPSS
jgi:hypothetical protein